MRFDLNEARHVPIKLKFSRFKGRPSVKPTIPNSGRVMLEEIAVQTPTSLDKACT